MGVGWDLDMGYIQRSTKWGFNYGGDDFIASFNGATVELVRRPDWDSEQNLKMCYGAKIEGAFTKYCRPSVGNEFSTFSWEATAKDGTKYYYGQTTASRQDFSPATNVFKWCLDKVVDTNGNIMTLTYSRTDTSGQNQGQIYLSRIDYTFKTDGASVNYIVFSREASTSFPDTAVKYTTGYPVVTYDRLKRIDVYGNGSLARSYVLDYLNDLNTSENEVQLGAITQKKER